MAKRIFYFLVSVFLLTGCDNISDIKSPSKTIVLLSREQVFAEGRWKRLSSVKSPTTPKINSVQIECDRRAMNCLEREAVVATRKDNYMLPDSALLYIQTTAYQVAEWSDFVIIAKAEPRASDISLRISLIDKSAEKTSRETSARGAVGANPNSVENWILE